MKKALSVFIVTIILVCLAEPAHSQIWPFRKRSHAAKASEDLEKRKAEAKEGNAFNELQPMGSSRSRERDDYIWTSETAYTTSLKNGNISLLTPSRVGIKGGMELSSLLAADFWVPNLMIKRTHFNKKDFLIATRHGLYSPSPGLNWAQKKGHQTIVDSLTSVPHIVTIRNEVIVSKSFDGGLSCSSPRPYLIITAAFAADLGVPFEENDLKQIDEHLLGSRNPALTGRGLLINARIRADAELSKTMYLEGGLKFFSGDMFGNMAMEHHAALQNFIFKNTSVTLGYILSIGNFSSANIKLFPSFDLTWYFGLKPGAARGLFNRKMF